MTRTAILLLVCVLLLSGAQPGRAQSATDGERIERAWSGWRVGEGGKLVAEGLRVTTGEGTQTIGRISRRACLFDECIGSSVARMIPNASFDIDVLLSEASLQLGFRGESHVARWASDGLGRPRASQQAGDPQVGRAAEAEGELYGEIATLDELRNARIVTGVTMPSVIPVGPPTLFESLLAEELGSCWRVRRAERQFATAHNESRITNGLSRVRLDPDLSRVARAHTRDMIAKDLLHHSTSLQLRKRISGWTILGENVGVGGTPDSLMDAFLDSPGHRANILHAGFKYFGVGTKRAEGRLWVTVIFEALKNPSTTMRMPRCR